MYMTDQPATLNKSEGTVCDTMLNNAISDILVRLTRQLYCFAALPWMHDACSYKDR